MTHEELIAFRDKVALPKLLELFENTQIPEGACYIDHVQISFFDGRSCGHESQFCASGYQYKDGQVQKYDFEEIDISLSSFLESHKDCLFLSDGKLEVSDELAELDLRTVLRNSEVCAKLFHDLKDLPQINTVFAPTAYYKMEYILKNNVEAVNSFTRGFVAEGVWGSWHTVDHMDIDGTRYFLMQHDDYDDKVESIIVDGAGKVVLDYVLSGFDEEAIEDIKREALVNRLFADISEQILEVKNINSYGEPQAFAELPNGRQIEVTLEQEMLPPDKQFCSVRLLCNEKEFDGNEFESSVGIVHQMTTSGASLEEVKTLLHSVLYHNELHPVKECYLENEDSLEAAQHKDLSSMIRDASSKTIFPTLKDPQHTKPVER